jgi:hypothetical protein
MHRANTRGADAVELDSDVREYEASSKGLAIRSAYAR